MKSKTIDAPKKKPIRFAESLTKLFDFQENVDLFYRTRDLEHVQKEEERYREHCNQLKVKRIGLSETVGALTKRKKETAAATEQKARDFYERMARHIGVTSVTADMNGNDPSITVKTPLIFVDVRTAEGARTERRMCIGQFDIVFYPNHESVKIFNRMFRVNSQYEHWAVRNNEPCRGSYGKDFSKSFADKDYYGIFDLIYHFLHSTDDGSAYMQSNKWRDLRDLSLLAQAPSLELKKGDTVIVTADDAQGKSIRGYVGKVLAIGSTRVCVEFKENVGGHSGDGGDGKEGHCWTMEKTCVAKIASELYEKKNIYELSGRNGLSETLAAIDALPDDATVEDAKELAIGYYSNRVRVELKDLVI